MRKKLSILLAVAMILSLFTFSAYGAEFTPSAEAKDAPGITVVVDQNGDKAAAIVYDSEGNEVGAIPVGSLLVTAVNDAASLPADLQEKMDNAYEQIQSAGTLDELTSDLKLSKEDTAAGVKMENLVVRDLIDVSLTGDFADYLDGTNSITIVFKLGVKPGEFLKVLHNYEGDQWEVIADDAVEVYANGDVAVTFTSLSPVAFVVDGSENAGAGIGGADAPTSPQTGEGFPVELLAALGFGLAAVFCFASARRKQEN